MITDPQQRQRIVETFTFLPATSAAFRADLFDHAALARLPAGQLICHDGAQCAHLPLVIAGTGRVYKLGENGREMTLYRIVPGESCVMTAACILSGQPFPAFAESETEIEAIVVRPADVRRWMTASEPWRTYLFSLIAGRLQEVFGVLDAVLFQRLDQRLITLLLRCQSGDSSGIHLTHQALAVELGSSREVVSRVLKGLEGQGLLRTMRGRIELLDVPGLEQRSQDG